MDILNVLTRNTEKFQFFSEYLSCAKFISAKLQDSRKTHLAEAWPVL